jgi:lipopolysaccharide transport protein LptA
MPKDQSPLELRAKQLRYLPGHNKLELFGKVTLSGGEFSLSCDNLLIMLGKDGVVRRVEGWGNLTWTLGGNTGRADRIHYMVQSKTLELVGNARLCWKRPGFHVQGRRIAIDLRTGRFSVQDAHADLSLGQPNGS